MTVSAEPRMHLWTREEYYRMAQVGLFQGKRVELIEGQIIVMSPMGSLHAAAMTLAARAVEKSFGEGYFVRWQMPLALGERSEPEPDVAVIAGDVRDYVHDHPATAVLIIEVADTSLAYDRTTKGSLYARAGIPDYWIRIINLIDSQVEVYRDPLPDPAAEYRFAYARQFVVRGEETITPLSQPSNAIRAVDLLP
ncbi:MAG: Uma2 family endonuclease [Roseiflexus sp.]|nr:Uma2 family endonuclease [Roseiflexus sp.]MCS7290593.1 Uma2 family endonuclease [Roseiflexus sp.]MDW8148179.1 Uma2 family endonuclease [Roseiflexaceae bacterium]MDW8231894.1 Uma2 family endonuclease [Roseiflexaceae bacterium]